MPIGCRPCVRRRRLLAAAALATVCPAFGDDGYPRHPITLIVPFAAGGIDALIVPYKGSPAVVNALRTGEIDLAFEILGPMLGQIKAGAVRPLAVTSDVRVAALKNVPTVREAAGLNDYVVASWNALAAPAGTPGSIVDRLVIATRTAIAAPATRARLEALGVRPQAGTPAELQALLESEIRRWRSVILAAHIPPQ